MYGSLVPQGTAPEGSGSIVVMIVNDRRVVLKFKAHTVALCYSSVFDKARGRPQIMSANVMPTRCTFNPCMIVCLEALQREQSGGYE